MFRVYSETPADYPDTDCCGGCPDISGVGASAKRCVLPIVRRVPVGVLSLFSLGYESHGARNRITSALNGPAAARVHSTRRLHEWLTA